MAGDSVVNVILRGVRVIDPLAKLDASGQDVWISDGRIVAIYRQIGGAELPVIDLTPPPGQPACILSPAFIDLHTHLREPGADGAESVLSGARAAAAGGFTHIVAMANTDPVIDSAELVTEASFRSVGAPIQVLAAAAVTKGLRGDELVDFAACAAAGAVAFSDDGRNAAGPRLLVEALKAADEVDRPIFVHPEDEEMIALANNEQGALSRCVERPAVAEASAVGLALRALHHAGRGRLHLQHVSAAPSIELLRRAKESGEQVTAEVTPHHLAMWLPMETDTDPPSLRKMNPPLRREADREAMIQALRDGVIDAVATDHAPHPAHEKTDDYAASAPGIIGLETALATCLTLGGMGDAWLPTLIERLTVGPWRVLGDHAGVREPRLRIGEAASCVLFDPGAEWTVGEVETFSLSRNTPLRGVRLKGRVLLTIADGMVVHRDTRRLPLTDMEIVNA